VQTFFKIVTLLCIYFILCFYYCVLFYSFYLFLFSCSEVDSLTDWSIIKTWKITLLLYSRHGTSSQKYYRRWLEETLVNNHDHFNTENSDNSAEMRRLLQTVQCEFFSMSVPASYQMKPKYNWQDMKISTLHYPLIFSLLIYIIMMYTKNTYVGSAHSDIKECRNYFHYLCSHHAMN